MEVIKKGPGWSRDVKCTGSGNGDGGCGSTLRVTLDDLFRTQSHARDESTDYITFRCCECGVMTDLASDDSRGNVPGHIWDAAAKGVKHSKGGYCHPNDRRGN